MYDRFIARLTRSPWAMLPEKLEEIAALLQFKADGGQLTPDEIKARLGDVPESAAPSRVDRTIAVIPVYGTITHRANSFEAFSGGTSTELLGKYIRRATADESVKAIVLDLSSPGGSTDGLPELAAEIRAARKVKPIVAHANALAASAAYWLASQASEFVVTPSGSVGALGVFMIHIDKSEQLAKKGIKVNAISAGTNKLDNVPWAPMSDETRAFLQKQVDAVYGTLIKDVASGRKMTQTAVEDRFGQGRVFQADEALKRGMVDSIETFDETIARLMQQTVTHSRRQRAEAPGLATLGEVAALNGTTTTTGTVGSTTTIFVTPPIVEEPPAAEEYRPSATDEVILPESVAASAVEETQLVAAAQLAADADYVDVGIRIAERL